MERIEQCARISIMRGISFTAFGIALTAIAFLYAPVIALKIAATLTGMTSVVLAFKGQRAMGRSYRKTETWLLLNRRHGLPEERAQQVIGGVLRSLYWSYAEIAAYVAIGLWVMSLVAALAGLPAAS